MVLPLVDGNALAGPQPELNADDDNNRNGGEGAGSTEASLLEAIENVRNALGVDDNLGRPFA